MVKMSPKVFIENHTHINYCEVIIDKNGLISYVKPSHTESLIKETGRSRDKIYKMIHISESPLIWLIKYTNCICVWSGFYMATEKINVKQREALQMLIDAGLTKKNNMINY